MSYHKWNGNMCVNCGLRRKSDFRINAGKMEGKPVYAHPGEKIWSDKMPECVDIRVIGERVIINTVNNYFGVDIFEKTRREEVVLPRQIAQTLLHTFSPTTFKSIAKLFHSDHATVMASKRKIWNMCRIYPDVRQKVIELETMIE